MLQSNRPPRKQELLYTYPTAEYQRDARGFLIELFSCVYLNLFLEICLCGFGSERRSKQCDADGVESTVTVVTMLSPPIAG